MVFLNLHMTEDFITELRGGVYTPPYIIYELYIGDRMEHNTEDRLRVRSDNLKPWYKGRG